MRNHEIDDLVIAQLWIIETKGRVWEGTSAKDDAIEDWCERVSQATGAVWRYVRINQTEFRPGAGRLQELIDEQVSDA